MTKLKGRALAMVADCSAPSPPASSRPAATTPSIAHQNTRCPVVVSVSPPAAMESMTSEPESDEVMKKMATSRMASVEVRPLNGRYSKKWKSPVEISAAMARPTSPAAIPVSMTIAVLPNTVIQMKVKPAGMKSTAVTNSRTVRPREMRAINMPTNGAHEIHHAQ
jgi:hypothetical protein